MNPIKSCIPAFGGRTGSPGRVAAEGSISGDFQGQHGFDPQPLVDSVRNLFLLLVIVLEGIAHAHLIDHRAKRALARRCVHQFGHRIGDNLWILGRLAWRALRKRATDISGARASS